MNQFEMVKLAVDIGVGTAILYLAFRFFRGGISEAQTRHIASLDASLKALVREAEIAGNNLNDQLLRRQQSIETAVNNAESSETKIQRSITQGKDLLEALDTQLKNVREQLVELERRKVRAEQIAASATQTAASRPRPSASPTPAPRIQREEFEEYQADEQSIEVEDVGSAPAYQRVNIYGEPIEEPVHVASEPQNSRSILQQAVEKIVEKKRNQALSRPALDAVHSAALEMLKNGKNLEAVASRTRLPLDEVKTLSQRMLQETFLDEPAPVTTASSRDQRLGVLAPPRRNEQIL